MGPGETWRELWTGSPGSRLLAVREESVSVAEQVDTLSPQPKGKDHFKFKSQGRQGSSKALWEGSQSGRVQGHGMLSSEPFDDYPPSQWKILLLKLQQ